MSPTRKSERPDLRAILHIALDMTDVVRDLQTAGHPVIPDDLATMSPYITERVKRFGEYPLDGLATPPGAFDPHLQLLTDRRTGVDPVDTAAA